MNAVRRVDLKARALARRVANDLVDAGRTIALFGCVIARQIDADRHRLVGKLEVAGLVFFVVGVGQKNRRQPIETDHPIGFRISDRRAVGRWLEPGVIGAGVAQRPRRLAAQQQLIDAKQQATEEQTLGHRRFEVARAVKLVIEPARAEGSGIARQFVVTPPTSERVETRLRRQRTALDRAMRPLDPRGVEETGVVADQRAARKNQFR